VPTLFKDLPDVEPLDVSWGHWLRVQRHNRGRAISWALRNPGRSIQRWTRLPWGRRAFALAVRTHLGRVDVRAMRETMMLIGEGELVGFASFGPAPRGLDELFEQATAFGLALEEIMMRNGHWRSLDDKALALRWMARGEPRMAAQVRLLIDLSEDRPPAALGPGE
jgi:hypothetical protein